MQFARSKYKVPFLSCYAVNNGIMMVVVVVVFYQGGKDLKGQINSNQHKYYSYGES